MSRTRISAAASLSVAAVLLWPLSGLEVTGEDRCLLFLPMEEGERLDLAWRHSVDGIPVRDSFVRRGGTLYLSASYNPFFAAGLGEISGRGRVVGTARHGLAIVDIDEPVERLPLRVGSPRVAHTLHHRGREYDLSARFAHRRVELTIANRARAYDWWLCGGFFGVDSP